jgi:putative MATE family efflux protein
MEATELAPQRSRRSTGTTRRVWALAWPAILTNMLQVSVGLIGTTLVSRQLGTSAISATGVGGRIFFMQQVVLMAITTGTMALVARAWGAGDRREAERVTRTSLWLCVGLAVALMLPCILFAHALASIFRLEHATTELTATYIRWVSLSAVPFAVAMVIATALRSAGDTRTPLAIGSAAAIVNISALWVFVGGGLGVHPLGVAGAAIANTLGAATGCAISFALWRRGVLTIGVAPPGADFEPARIRRLLRIGLPAGLEGLGFQVGFAGFIIIVAAYGDAANAAYQIGVQLLSISFLVGQAFSIASSTLVGQHLGADDPEGAERSGWRAMTLAIAVMVVFGGLVIGGAEPLARFMSRDDEVVRLTVVFIWVLGSVQALMAIEFTIGGALRGAGDTRFPLFTVLAGITFGRLAFSALFAFLDLGIEWIYAALIADYIIKGILFLGRFRTGRWKTILRPEREETEVLGDAPEREAG